MNKKTKVFYNRIIDKKQLKQIMSWAFNELFVSSWLVALFIQGRRTVL